MKSSLLSRLSDNHPLSIEDNYHWTETSREILLMELGMLLTSRSRIPGVDAIPMVNASVMNYGIDESFQNITSRKATLESRLKNALARFEPRLQQVTVTCDNDTEAMVFTLRARYLNKPFVLELRWNDCTGRFYFNE